MAAAIVSSLFGLGPRRGSRLEHGAGGQLAEPLPDFVHQHGKLIEPLAVLVALLLFCAWTICRVGAARVELL